MVDNLRGYLARCDPREPNIYGHALKFPGSDEEYDAQWLTHFVAGQAVVLARESLRRLVDVAMRIYPLCFSEHGQGTPNVCMVIIKSESRVKIG